MVFGPLQLDQVLDVLELVLGFELIVEQLERLNASNEERGARNLRVLLAPRHFQTR